MSVPLPKLEEILTRALPGAKVILKDLVGDGDHLQGVIVASEFKGQPLLKRHQMVLAPLQELLKEQLHAFTFKTYTPEEWEKKNGGQNVQPNS